MKIVKLEENSLFSYLCGKLLGDGCITVQKGRKPRFQFMHQVNDYDWCFFCYSQLKSFIPLNPPAYSKVIDSRLSKGFSERYIVQSKTSEVITYLESIWYQERKKLIPFDFLNQYFNEKSLAWWYLDDGHLKMAEGTPRKIILSTDNFTRDDNIELIKLLDKKFLLKFSLDGQNRLVLYDQMQIIYFYRLIEPHIHPSMERKMIKFHHSLNPTTVKRTTIYLPIEITITTPTSEINQHLNSLQELHQLIINRNEYFNLYKKHFTNLSQIKNTKPYTIKMQLNHWSLINSIQCLTGLTKSQIVTLCYNLNTK